MKPNQKNPSLLFWGLMGYDRPSTRIRCVNFADQLRRRGYDCDYVLYRDRYGPKFGHEQMLHIGDRVKLGITRKAYSDHKNQTGKIIYLQKAHWHAAAPYLLNVRKNMKMIFDYDDWDLDRSPFFNHALLNSLFFGSRDEVVITWKLLDRSVACVAASRGLEALLKERHTRVYYIPTGPDADLFSLTNEQRAFRASLDETVFLWCGNIWGTIMLGNVVFLLNCFAKVYDTNPNVRLRILTWGTYAPVAKALVSTTYQHLPIDYLEFVPPDRMPEFLAGAHVGLLPLVGDDMNIEWLKNKSPTKQFEYMSMDMATVATPLGDVTELIADGANGFLAESEEQFVQKMLTLAGARGLCERMGSEARKTILESYCLERLGDKLEAMLNELKQTELI